MLVTLHSSAQGVAAMRPIARCGYTADYTVLDRLFQMERPR